MDVEILLALLYILAGLLGAVLLAILLLPIHVSADGQLNLELLDGRAEARWGWGLLALRLTPGRGAWLHLLGRPVRRVRLQGRGGRRRGEKDAAEAAREDAAEAAREDAADDEARAPRRGPRWAVRHRRALLRVAGRLYRALGLRARLRGAVGLDDPAETAVVWGALMQLQAALPGLELAVQPDFLDENLELEGTLRGRIWPVHLVVVVAGQLLRADTRAMLARPRLARD